MTKAYVLAKQKAPAHKNRSVFVTGAAGRIGSYFAEHAFRDYTLTLMLQGEEEQPSDFEKYGRIVRGDITDMEFLKTSFQGCDTILHLAADASPEQVWESLLHNNIIGTYNVFAAAKAAKCRRVIFASSIHAVSGYPQGVQIHAHDPVNPGDMYGVTKCFGEAMGRFLSREQGISVIAIRIGAFQPHEKAEQAGSIGLMDTFISRRDLNQLFHRCIDDTKLQFAIFQALSGNRFNRMDISDACELVGFEPEDDITEENPVLRRLDLQEKVAPHDEQHGQQSGMREDV